MPRSKTLARFVDSGATIYSVMEVILVVCPRCEGCARIALLDPEGKGLFAPRILTCGNCGYSNSWAKNRIKRGWHSKPAVDDFFAHPLWLQAPFGDDYLWAYNPRHLGIIENYVRATLRVHKSPPDAGRSLINRLPQWIREAKHRPRLLRAIRKLKAKAHAWATS